MSQGLVTAIRILKLVGRHRAERREAFAWGVLFGLALGTVAAILIRRYA